MLPPLSLNAWLRFDAIRRSVRAVRPASVLEVGAGQGAMGTWLADRSAYTGFEPDPESRSIAHRRIADRGEVLAELPQTTVDLVCAFEVLEHIEDDGAALDDWRRRLRPHGRLMLSVPAHRARFGPCDELVGHFRRYDRDELVDLVTRHGFEVENVASYGTGLGHLLETARNAISRRQAVADSMDERSAGSGRFLQLGDGLAPLLAVVAVPFRILQRPFAGTGLGVGWVLRARRTD